MKRNPRKVGWTKAYRYYFTVRHTGIHTLITLRAAHGKELKVDSTLKFAQRRNVPVRYNRDLVATTLKAMARVEEIRQRRERAFYKERMRGNKERQREADKKLVEENQHLLPPEERTLVEKDEVVLPVDAMEEELSEELSDLEEELPKTKQKTKVRRKQKLTVDGDIEMED